LTVVFFGVYLDVLARTLALNAHPFCTDLLYVYMTSHTSVKDID